MGSGLQDCVVAFFDLAGIKRLAPHGDGSRQMRRLHDVVMHATAGNGLDRIARAYTWNDSVLLLAYVNNPDGYERTLRHFSEFKILIDQVSASYCAVVKGQSFPSPRGSTASKNSRFVFIEASSYAMANCMDIPERFKNARHQWYLDERVSRELRGLLAQPARQLRMPFLPTSEERYVYAYDNLWLDDQREVRDHGAPVPR